MNVCSNEGPVFFLGADNKDIAKVHWQNSRVFTNNGPSNSKKGNYDFFSFIQCYGKIIALHKCV